MSAENIQEAAAGLLEDAEPERETAFGDGGEVIKKALLSTTPNPPIDQVQEDTGFSLGGAYGWRGFKKSLNGIGMSLGIGDNVFKSALFDYGRSLYHLAQGDRGGEEVETAQVTETPDGQFDLTEPEEPNA